MKPILLIIEDETKIRELLSRMLSYEGYEILQAPDIRTTRKLLSQTEIDLVLCDVKLPDGNGVVFLQEIKAVQPWIEVLLLTAYGNIPESVSAIKGGAFDYLVKGDDNEKIIPHLSKAYEKVELQKRIFHLEKQLTRKYSFDSIIGESPAIKEAIHLARKVAQTDASVLLLGETGVGKEVFAKAIHYEGKRKAKPFVAINCSAISHELMESELFGHVAGAFTGATKDKKGFFEAAQGGTLFLDEIGELPLDLQAKLLRVLENGAFTRVGDTIEQQVDVRIIAATNRNLEQESQREKFRLDLYYRLSVFSIHLPSLIQRAEDIPALATYFTQLFCAASKKKVLGLSKDFITQLKEYPWKGNVRELRNLIERAVILCEGVELTPVYLPQTLSKNTPADNDLSLATAEKAQIEYVLKIAGGNKTKAARLLGIGLTTLYQKIKDYSL